MIDPNKVFEEFKRNFEKMSRDEKEKFVSDMGFVFKEQEKSAHDSQQKYQSSANNGLGDLMSVPTYREVNTYSSVGSYRVARARMNAPKRRVAASLAKSTLKG